MSTQSSLSIGADAVDVAHEPPSNVSLYLQRMFQKMTELAFQDNVARGNASLEREIPETKLLGPPRGANGRGNEFRAWLSFQTSVVLPLDAGLWRTNVAPV